MSLFKYMCVLFWCITVLFPFKVNWPEINKEKFKLANTLDKKNAKIAAHDAELSFSEGYRSFQTLAITWRHQ